MNDIWTLQKVLKWTIDYFSSHNIPEARLGAELLLAQVLGCRRIDLYVQFERVLSKEERAAYRGMVQRRVKREPVQYILGETEFMGLPFKVTSDVLIPRPDTEHLVDRVVGFLREEQLSAPSILDIGTGSGCIAISLAHLFPDAAVTAVDISETALAIAAENARNNDLEITLTAGDIFSLMPQFTNAFDVVVSNPPYISGKDWPELQPEVKEFEPRQALYGGEDGLEFYQRFVPAVKGLLKTGGAVFLETGYDQAKVVGEMCRQQDFHIEIFKDYQQIERIVAAYTGERSPDGGEDLEIGN